MRLTAVARSQVQIPSPVSVSRIETSLIRTGSASALSRRAISRAVSSSRGAADTGAQQIGALMSTIGRAFGMTRPYPGT
ncbi:Uncharacterised protein [Mycobacteroides abscessus subsp. abscessus]|nr:Uncharacterised protein [Mycobacteroides abscessus subsp. abscessus]